jgi:hypothetical protein
MCFVTIFLAGCGTVSTVRTLPEGERALSFSLGGPVATLPGIADLPLPYTALRYRWGVVENLEAHIGLHPTMLAFGTLGLDVGLAYEFLHQNGPVPSLCLGLNPTMWLNPFNQDGVGAAPSTDLVASWFVHPDILVYTGGQAFFQLEEPYVPWTALVGSEFRIGKYLGLGLEIKWYAPLEDSEFRVVNFPLSPGNQGAFGIVLGASLYPGGGND